MDTAANGIRPQGEALRQALRWLSERGEHTPAAIDEACRRFDLSPRDADFLLAQFRADRGVPVPD